MGRSDNVPWIKFFFEIWIPIFFTVTIMYIRFPFFFVLFFFVFFCLYKYKLIFQQRLLPINTLNFKVFNRTYSFKLL